MADYSWMTQSTAPVANAGVSGLAEGPSIFGNPWLTAIGLLGQTGAGMLQGTDKQWLGAPGAVMAGAARNMQAQDLNKQTLEVLLNALRDPLAQGGSLSMKPDGGVNFNLKTMSGQDQMSLAQPQPSAVNKAIGEQLSKQTGLVSSAPTVSGGVGNQFAANALGNYPFLSAL